MRSIVGFAACVFALVLSAQTKPATAPAPQWVLADCVSYEDQKLTLKLRTDDPGFKSYVAAKFTYPKAAGLQNAKVGETYLITFVQGEAAHNVKKAVLIDAANPAKEVPEDSMIAKVVGIKEMDAKGQPLEARKQGVIVQFNQDENVGKFFAKNQIFPIHNPGKRDYKAGQVIKIVFEADNRHCKGYVPQ